MPRDITQDPLYDFFPDWVLTDVRLEKRVPDRVCDRCCNRTAVNVLPGTSQGRRMLRVPGAGGLIKIGANPDDHTIVLHPDYYREDTATGEALRGHELVHVQQRRQIPNFARAYHNEAIRCERLGETPWECNKFEKPAYAAEQIMKDELLARGFPL